MQLPNVGQPGSILSILIPGTFLLFNIIVGLYLFFDVDLKILKNLEGSLSIIVFLLLVCFGYLLGAILRLLKCDVPDNLSGCYLHHIENRILKMTKPIVYRNELAYEDELLIKKKFPYIEWLGIKCSQQYPEAKKFYDRTWGNYKHCQTKRKQSFLNFCKVLLTSIDKNLADECYASEALNRYLSSMFYGISFSSVIIFILILRQLLFNNNGLSLPFLFLEVFYIISVWLITRNYRFIRAKEVETVFAATFAVKEKFESICSDINSKRGTLGWFN